MGGVGRGVPKLRVAIVILGSGGAAGRLCKKTATAPARLPSPTRSEQCKFVSRRGVDVLA